MALARTETPGDEQQAARPKRRFQFSVWTLLVLMTAVCILLAIPGAAILFASVGFWLVVAAGIVLVILALQAPGYYILRHIRQAAAAEANDEESTSRPVSNRFE